MALEPLLDQSEKGNVGKSKQLVPFFSSTLFEQALLCGHYVG